MKKPLIIVACLVGFVGSAFAQSVQVNIDAGQLRTVGGTAVVPNGMLLQLIASPSGNFSAPNSSAYVTGDNVLLQSFAMNSNSGVAGETLQTVNFNLTSTVTTGTQLLLRFYPSLTAASAPASPTLATTYGQVRSSTLEFGPSVDPAETAWVVPAAGAAVSLYYVTVSAGNGGTYSNASAYANNIVVAVPEPSSVLMLGGAVVGALGWMGFRRRQA